MTLPQDFSRRAFDHLQRSADVKREVGNVCVPDIIAAAAVIADTFRGGGRLYLCGNGGSAADCQHMAAEFVSRLSKEFVRTGLSAVALTTDTSFLTAYGNDFGFDGIFERQVQAHGRPGDTLLGISTSGSSRNVMRAVAAARALKLRSVVLIGGGGTLRDIADVTIAVPSTNTQHIQESHIAIEHIICDLVEQELFGASPRP